MKWRLGVQGLRSRPISATGYVTLDSHLISLGSGFHFIKYDCWTRHTASSKFWVFWAHTWVEMSVLVWLLFLFSQLSFSCSVYFKVIWVLGSESYYGVLSSSVKAFFSQGKHAMCLSLCISIHGIPLSIESSSPSSNVLISYIEQTVPDLMMVQCNDFLTLSGAKVICI